jgi:hypothetical protein
MNICTRLIAICAFLVFFHYSLSGADKTVQSVTITQLDTIALKGMPAQPLMKIKITVTGTTGTITLQKLLIHTANQNNSDVDSVAVYYTSYNDRFSLSEYPGEAYLLDKRKKIAGDTVLFDNLSHILETGDNYFWITMDLNKYSRASRTLDAFIKSNGIKIGDNYYPVSDVDPAGNIAIADIYFHENFEVKNQQGEPVGWSQEQISGSPVRWINKSGGYGLSYDTGHPSSSKSGNYNVMLQRQSYTQYKTILVSDAIDLSLSTRPLLTFYHAQVGWCKDAYCNVIDNDELRVLYKIGESGTWNELHSYTLATPNTWTKRELYLPEGVTPSNLYLGFEGTTKYGWGVCIDSISIFETGIIPRELNSVIVKNSVTDIVPQGSSQNPVLRVDMRIKGNTGNINLNSLKITSNNTSDVDIPASGVKLFYTNDSVYKQPVQIGTAQSFTGGIATFSGLSRVLETGDNFFWVTYDVKADATPGHIIDAKINTGDIGLSISGTYPSVDISPEGSRTIKQALFFDDFENTPQWTMNGEFQIGTPMGKGGKTKGSPDPSTAYSGLNVLGTDLTGLGSNLGDYEQNLSAANAYKAVSPLISGKYYKNIQLSFYRYLNIDNTDTAAIEYKLENSANWVSLWTSGKRYIETNWQKQDYSGLKFLERKKFNLRFRLGPTDAIDNYSGWNIDYLFLTADSIPYDAAVQTFISPVSSCGLTSAEHVKVYVKNNGPHPLVNTPIKLSLNGGLSYITETIPGTIAIDDSVQYTFTTPSDFSKPAIYTVIVKAAYPGDNYNENDSVVSKVIAFPTYTLPYTTGFEQDTTFWFADGLNNSWNACTPSGAVINKAAEGSICWKTDESGYHNLYEYSYTVSPCLSFSGKEIPMMDIKFNSYTNPNKDGAILEYSTDQGKNWKYASEDSYPFSWNWYNDTITSLKHKGWTNRTLDGGGLQTWKQGRQILPAVLANQNKVMFRFVFKSDSSTLSRYEGFAFDDLKVYDAPFDIGIDTITGLSPIACQYVNSPNLNVVIKNYGIRRMAPGDTIIIKANVNGSVQAVDTFQLATYLNTNATLNYTMKKPVDFSQTGNYVIKAYTSIEKDKTFYGTPNNDTASIAFTVYQNPVTGLPDSIFSARLDTVKINAIDSVKYSYYWQGSATPGTHIYSSVTGEGSYTLRVQNKISYCETKDTVVIKALISDIAVKQILAPVNNCGYKGNIVHPVIRIKNEGTDTLRKSKVIPVQIKLDSDAVLNENIILSHQLNPDSSYLDSLSVSLNLSSAKIYTLKIYSQMPYDAVKSNDTATVSFEIYGYPNIDLGPAQINVMDTSYRIIAQSGYNSYLWSNDSTTRFNTVKKSGRYKVTVTDIHLCPATDSIDVFLKIRDIKPWKLVSPATTCSNSGLSDITVRLLNAGTDTIKTNDSIIFTYRFNGGISVPDTFVSKSNILPGDSIDFTFDKKEDLTAVGTYNFKIGVLSKIVTDFYPANDSANYNVKVYGLPNPDLGTLNVMQALQWPLDPGNGFVSYQWQDGSTDSVYIITKDHYTSDDRYRVTVTDKNGCSATTPWCTRILIVTDVTVSEINMTNSACYLTNKELVSIKVKNDGNTPIQSSKIILLKYQINGGSFSKVDTLPLSSTFIKDQVISYTFKQLADLSQILNYKVKVYVEFDQDINIVNDTLSHWISIHGSPQVNFGAANDTLVVDCPYTLDAGVGYSSYLWSTAATQQTISAATPGKYSVTVVDVNGCSGSKSVNIVEKVLDLGITGFGTPLSNCILTNSETISVEVKNTGSILLTNQPLSLRYILNGTIDKTQNFVFTGAPGSKMVFTFTEKENLSAISIHNFNVTLTSTNDEVSANNNQIYNVTVSGNPVVDFGAVNDTIRTSLFPHVLDAGFGFTSYKWQDNSTNRTFSAPGQGAYSVTVTSAAGCTASKSVYIKNTLSSGKLSDKAKLVIYPNPATDYILVKLDLKYMGDATLELVTSDGKIVLNRLLKGNQQYMEQIEVGTLPRGMYYIRIYNIGWLVTDKILMR